MPAALGQSRKYVLRNRNITGTERNMGVLQKAKPSLRDVMPDYCVVLSSLGSKNSSPRCFLLSEKEQALDSCVASTCQLPDWTPWMIAIRPLVYRRITQPRFSQKASSKVLRPGSGLSVLVSLLWLPLSPSLLVSISTLYGYGDDAPPSMLRPSAQK